MIKKKRSRAYLFCPTLLLLTTSFSNSLKGAPTKTKWHVANTTRSASAPTGSDTLLPVRPALDASDYYQQASKKSNLPPVPLNRQAATFVSGYLQKNDYALQKIKNRSQPYFKIIEAIFQQHGIPAELKYLAVVESELKRTAVSPVGAAGPWQLMPVTARELGLKITSKNDERKHYYKSTNAAAKYLKRLYTAFDDWLLVIAAYNSGPGTVYKAIRQSGSRNFWKLQHFLPAETRGHVKRFIGTHYYFEADGSETTLTKAEKTAFAKTVAQLASERNKIQFVWDKSVALSDDVVAEVVIQQENNSTGTALDSED